MARTKKDVDIVGMSREELRKRLNKTITKGDRGNAFMDPTCSTVGDSYSSGVFAMDIALGTRGFAKRRIVELFGEESSGKTLVSLLAIIEAQRQYGLPSIFVDAEHAFDYTWFKKLGGDIDLIDVVSDFTYAEPVWDAFTEAVESGIYAFGVVDSLVGMVPQDIVEKSLESSHVGVDSRLNTTVFRTMASKISKNTSVLVINQVREKIGVMFGSPETTPGGKALKFYSSQRVKLLPPRSTDRESSGTGTSKVFTGHLVRGEVVKNKLAPPKRQFTFKIDYEFGANNIQSLLGEAVKVGLLEGSTLLLDKEHKFSSGRAIQEALREDMDLRRTLWEEVLNRASGVTSQFEEGEEE